MQILTKPLSKTYYPLPRDCSEFYVNQKGLLAADLKTIYLAPSEEAGKTALMKSLDKLPEMFLQLHIRDSFLRTVLYIVIYLPLRKKKDMINYIEHIV